MLLVENTGDIWAEQGLGVKNVGQHMEGKACRMGVGGAYSRGVRGGPQPPTPLSLHLGIHCPGGRLLGSCLLLEWVVIEVS